MSAIHGGFWAAYRPVARLGRFCLPLIAAALSPLRLPAGEPPARGVSATEGVVKMTPYRVMPEWITLQPVFDADGRMQRITFAEVTPGSPADAAGIRRGCLLVTLQGIDLRGMTKEAFDRTLKRLRFGDTLELGVLTPSKLGIVSDKSFRLVTLPLDKPPATSETTRAAGK